MSGLPLFTERPCFYVIHVRPLRESTIPADILLSAEGRSWSTMAIRSLLTILSLLSTSVAIASHGDRDPLKPLTDRLETSKITTKYGPFLVPSKNEDNGMKSFTLINATKPCDECILASMQADLLYPDGRVANANNGMWLHHVLMLNTGRQDTSCPQVYERFFASGNERTVVDLSNGG